MAKKEEATEEQTTDSVEKSTEEVKEEPQPSGEDLQAQLDAAKAEAEQNLNLYKEQIQKKESSFARREQELEQRAEVLNSIYPRLDSIEEYQAMQADYLEEMRGVQGIEERPQVRRSHLDELRQRREETKKQVDTKSTITKSESQVDPEDMKAAVLAQGLIKEMGWDESHPAVKKVWNLEDPKKALEILKKEQKTQRDTENEETVQAELKKRGVTTPETAGPSGQGTRSYTPAQIAAMSYEEYASNKESIEKAYRAGNIK